jgi:hypothetical protein
MLLVFAVVGPFSSSSSYNAATHSPHKASAVSVCEHINSTSILCIYLSIFLSFFLSLKQEHLLFVCLFVSKRNKTNKLFFSKKICFVHRFFLSAPPQVLSLGWFFFP